MWEVRATGISKCWHNIFFFGNEMKHSRHSDNNKPTYGRQSSSQPGLPEVIHDLIRWWDLTITRAAEQAKMVPHLSRHASQNAGFTPRFGTRQQPHESVHFLRQPPLSQCNGDKCDIHCPLCATKQGRTIRHDFDPAAPSGFWDGQVHVTDHNIPFVGYPSACFAAHPGCSTLDSVTPSSQHPCSGTRGAMMAKTTTPVNIRTTFLTLGP